MISLATTEESHVDLALRRMREILEMDTKPEDAPVSLWIDAAKLILKELGKTDRTPEEILDRQLEQMSKTAKADQKAGL